MGPFTITFDKTAYFDCDETLVFVDSIPEGVETVMVQIPGFPPKLCGVHKAHVERLKNHKSWSNGVVVWSKSGYKWAEAVVRALDLREYVDLCIAKPEYYYDDKSCCDFMPPRRFLNG